MTQRQHWNCLTRLRRSLTTLVSKTYCGFVSLDNNLVLSVGLNIFSEIRNIAKEHERPVTNADQYS
jgi:hypothetical protein